MRAAPAVNELGVVFSDKRPLSQPVDLDLRSSHAVRLGNEDIELTVSAPSGRRLFKVSIPREALKRVLYPPLEVDEQWVKSGGKMLT